MKLHRLKLLDAFRSLPANFEMLFNAEYNETSSVRCFVGRNGSGKSNVLEAIASIFYHTECVYLDYLPQSLTQKDDSELESNAWTVISEPRGFELEYFMPIRWNLLGKKNRGDATKPNDAHIKIVKHFNAPPELFWMNRKDFEENADERLNRIEVKVFLPDFIVGYSSGDNEVLSLPFFRMRFIHLDEYTEKLSIQDNYRKPEGRLIYLDNQYNQAILICNFLFQPPSILKLFRDEIELESISEFRLVIRKHKQVEASFEYLASLSPEQREKGAQLKFNLISFLERKDVKSHQESVLEKLIKCATAINYEDNLELDAEVITLDYWINEATKSAFLFHFDNALELFRTFQILLTLNYFVVEKEYRQKIYHSKNIYLAEDIIPLAHEENRTFSFKDLRLVKKGISNVLYSRSLSDGEYQFVHIIGLSLLFQNQNALFLLDEPETHLNPSWRARFVTILTDYLEPSTTERVFHEVLLTTHSPFITSDCRPSNVFCFKKVEGKITCQTATELGLNTFGTSVDIILDELFGQRQSIGHKALKELQFNVDNLVSQEDFRAIRHKIKRLGSSLEKDLALALLKSKEIEKKV